MFLKEILIVTFKFGISSLKEVPSNEPWMTNDQSGAQNEASLMCAQR